MNYYMRILHLFGKSLVQHTRVLARKCSPLSIMHIKELNYHVILGDLKGLGDRRNK